MLAQKSPARTFTAHVLQLTAGISFSHSHSHEESTHLQLQFSLVRLYLPGKAALFQKRNKAIF